MEEIKGYTDITFNGQVVPLRIEGHQIIEQAHLAKNVAVNLDRGVPRFLEKSGIRIPKDEPLAIVSCGHSLNDQIDELREFKNILVCGSAHDQLVRKGIIPTYATVADGGVDDKGNLSLAHKETTYLLASQCDPSLFDQLADFPIEMWHYRGQTTQDFNKEAQLLRGEPAIGWGCTVTLTSIHIAILLGYQHLHFFGFDNCYSKYGVAYHACEVAGAYEFDKVPVKIGERLFITNMGLVSQVDQFFKLLEMWCQWFHVYLHGDGLPHEMVRQGDQGLLKFVSLA